MAPDRSRTAGVKVRRRTPGANGMHKYFVAVAQVRYIMRKVFRLIDDDAKKLDLDPLAHQALLQIYGSPGRRLRVSALAERLDIVTPFASSIVKQMMRARLVQRRSDTADMRVSVITLTRAGRDLCRQIDSRARSRVDGLIRELDAEERKVALSILPFYVGSGVAKRLSKRLARTKTRPPWR